MRFFFIHLSPNENNYQGILINIIHYDQ